MIVEKRRAKLAEGVFYLQNNVPAHKLIKLVCLVVLF